MGSVSLLAKFFALAFSALLPLINPLGSALVLLGLVGDAPAPSIVTLHGRLRSAPRFSWQSWNWWEPLCLNSLAFLFPWYKSQEDLYSPPWAGDC